MTIALAPRLDMEAAAPLRLALLQRLDAGEAVIADGERVERIGQACLQVLAAARAGAAARALPFRIVRPSPALIEMVELAALDLADLN